ncbi:MAG: hypothetical protein JXP34_04885 [Planctomycetes bacterium]|nr:hypothetical protein [Planctomycetota bacterium]
MRRTLLAACLALAAGGAGCCGWPRPPDPDKYFDRTDPCSAFRYFQYSLEAEYWDRAFASLYLEGEELETLTPLRFRLAARRYPLEAFDGLTLQEAASSIQDVIVEERTASSARLVTFSDLFEQLIFLEWSGTLWLVDLKRSADSLFGGPAALP